MKRTILLALAFLIVMGFAITQAQEPQEKPKSSETPVIDKREQNQKARIKQGVKSGELTKKEARRLAAEQKKIKHDEKKAKADGVVTPEEKAKLRNEQRKASKDINRQKHDAQKRKS
ncbi:MAG: hypothetical protein HW374_656 [Bacteroidetes bacterium]|nr:hypothetical protein [Bacteroidota bacterium]